MLYKSYKYIGIGTNTIEQYKNNTRSTDQTTVSLVSIEFRV